MTLITTIELTFQKFSVGNPQGLDTRGWQRLELLDNENANNAQEGHKKTPCFVL